MGHFKLPVNNFIQASVVNPRHKNNKLGKQQINSNIYINIEAKVNDNSKRPKVSRVEYKERDTKMPIKKVIFRVDRIMPMNSTVIVFFLKSFIEWTSIRATVIRFRAVEKIAAEPNISVSLSE